MKNYFDENYEVLLERDEYNEYIINEKCEECNVFIDCDVKGNEVIGIQTGGRNWYLGSRYDNEYYLNTWLNSFELSSFKAVICVFGMGDYKGIDKLVNKFPENPIIVYEPNLSYFKTLMEAYDLTDIFKKTNVAFLSGNAGLKMFKNLAYMYVDITNYKTSIFKINTQYGTLYAEELDKWNNIVQDCVTGMLTDKNTYKKFGQERLDNNLANYYDCVKSRNVKELIDVVSNCNGKTAILVAAGPSLDKNIQLLKEAKNKAFILAVDTAIKPVLNAGIVPDLTISVDSHKPPELFKQNGEYVDIPIVADLQSNAEVISGYKGKRFYSYNFDKSFFNIYMKEDYMEVCLDSGGSVANDAFSFLVKCGFKNIVFIGQDLAYSNTKTPAGAAYDNEDIIKFEKSDKHFLIEDIYGEQVYTEANMDLYRKWFERNIAEHDNIQFIDATEGGAKINGTEILSFRETIDKYVKDLPFVDFESIIKNIEDISKEELNLRMERLKKVPDEIRETKKDIIKAMRLYDELEKLNRENKQGSSRVAKITGEINELVNNIEDGFFVAFTSNIIDDTEYDILEEIYEDKSNLYEEIKLVVDSGRKILNKYLDKYDDISGKIIEMVENAVTESK